MDPHRFEPLFDIPEDSYGFGIIDEETCIEIAKNIRLNHHIHLASCFGIPPDKLKRDATKATTTE